MKPGITRKQEGAVAIELAILLVPLLMIGFGAAEFGRAMYTYNTLAKATRNAARHLSTLKEGDATIELARCLVRYGNPDCAGALVLADVSDDKVQFCDATNASDCAGVDHSAVGVNPVVNLVTVKVSGYVFTPLAPYLPTPITFPSIGTTMRQGTI